RGGIPGREAERLLAGDEGRAEVLGEEARYKSLGVSGVPSFFCNGQFAFSGAAPAPLLADAIRQVLPRPAQDTPRAAPPEGRAWGVVLGAGGGGRGEVPGQQNADHGGALWGLTERGHGDPGVRGGSERQDGGRGRRGDPRLGRVRVGGGRRPPHRRPGRGGS